MQSPIHFYKLEHRPVTVYYKFDSQVGYNPTVPSFTFCLILCPVKDVEETGNGCAPTPNGLQGIFILFFDFISHFFLICPFQFAFFNLIV